MRSFYLIFVSTVFYAALTVYSMAGSLESQDSGLRVAAFKCDVTLPLGQILYNEPLKTIEHPLLAKGIVLDDGRRRFVLCAVDWCTMKNATHDIFREKLAEAVETDIANVAVHCVHQHTAPSHDASAEKLLIECEGAPRCRDLEFLEQVTDRLAAAAKASLKTLREVDFIGTGQAKVDRVASSRRIVVKGKLYGRMSSTKNPKLQALSEGFIDPMLKTITLADGEQPVVRLHYYATHPQSFYRDGRESWDVPGIARERLEKKERVFQIYFTGCAGDVAMGKYNNGTRLARTELAERLYNGMLASVASTRLVPIGSICWRNAKVLFPPKTKGCFDTDKNRKIIADNEAEYYNRIRAASNLACTQRLAEPIDISLLQIGNVYIVHLPGEPMVAFQKYAQSLCPDDFVAVAGYGQGTPRYICTEEAFNQGGYEPNASAVQPQSEKLLKAAIRELLSSNTSGTFTAQSNGPLQLTWHGRELISSDDITISGKKLFNTPSGYRAEMIHDATVQNLWITAGKSNPIPVRREVVVKKKSPRLPCSLKSRPISWKTMRNT